MNHRLSAVLFLLGVPALLLSCSPKPMIELKPEKIEIAPCLPQDLVIDSTAGDFARMEWNPGCPEIRVLRGFNIYLSRVPLVSQYPGRDLSPSIKPFNEEVYPGDTLGNPDLETFDLRGIENATAYYVHVRAVYTDMTLSPPTNEVELVVYLQGEFALMPSFTGEHDGFNIAKSRYCRADDLDNDVYFFHKDGRDYLCSPSRLGPVNRATTMYSFNEDDPPEDWWRIPPDAVPSDKVALAPRRVFVIVTADGHPARLKIVRTEGAGDSRSLTFEYIYRPAVRSQGSSAP